MSYFFTRTSMMIAIALLFINNSFAEKPISILVGFSEKQEAKIKEIEKVLDQTGTIKLNNTPLIKLPAILSKQLGVTVHLDKKVFKEEDIEIKDTDLIDILKNISYRAALKIILNDFDADIIFHHDVLLITTKERINTDPTMRQTRIYPVEEFVKMIDNLPQGSGREVGQDFESIINMLITTIDPWTWQGSGEGEGTVSGLETKNTKVLVITQTPDVHRKIEILLAKLRKHHQSQIKEKKSTPAKK